MTEALLLAGRAAELDEVPVGAVIVFEDQIIGRGFNLRETIQKPISHAEIHAVLQAASHLNSWRLYDCDLYVTLEPCLMCLGAMSQARIRKCIFGALDVKGGALSLGYPFQSDERLNHRFEVEYFRNDYCGNILTEFFRKKRQKSKSL